MMLILSAKEAITETEIDHPGAVKIRSNKAKERITYMKLEGSLNNRLLENHEYCDQIVVGTGMTEYHYTDRDAYEVVEVIDQKHVAVREYDHVNKNGDMSNTWELISNPNNPTMLMVKRGKYWYQTITVEKDYIEQLEKADDTESKLQLCKIMCHGFDTEKIKANGKQTKYFKKNVSFGVADYHFDYEF